MDKKLILDKLYTLGEFSSKAKFAKFLEIKPQNLSNWYKRNTYDEYLLAAKFTNVNINWLLTGEGEMLKSSTHPQEITPIVLDDTFSRILSINESQQRTIELQAKIIENLTLK